MARTDTYTFRSRQLPNRPGPTLSRGGYHCVHFTFSDPDEHIDALLDIIEDWFADRDDVILVGNGTTSEGSGFIVLEWEGVQIDPAFLAVLKQDELVTESSVYLRDQDDEDEDEDITNNEEEGD